MTVRPCLPSLARELAIVLHHGQTRRDGEPYANHVIRVATYAAPLGSDYRTVGYLHDTLEDTKADLGLLKPLFPTRILNAVLQLTRYPDALSYSEYIDAMIEKGDVLALQVKLADLYDHIRCARRDGKEPRGRYQRADLAIRRALLRNGVDPLRVGGTR